MDLTKAQQNYTMWTETVLEIVLNIYDVFDLDLSDLHINDLIPCEVIH